jgi:hypothetical protein
LSLAWLTELLISTGKVVLPAVLIALIGQFFILRWQYRYRHLERITAMQDESYRDAKSVLVRMAYYPETLATSIATAPISETASVSPGDMSPDIAQAATRALQQSISDRMALANLSNDIHRLFSPKAYSTVADAAAELYRYHDAFQEAAVAAQLTEGGMSSDLQLQRTRCVFKVQRALDVLAREIGRDPSTRPLFRRSVQFGRRREDIPDAVLTMIPESPATRGRQAGKQRRYTDAMITELAQSKRATPDQRGPAPDAASEDA